MMNVKTASGDVRDIVDGVDLGTRSVAGVDRMARSELQQRLGKWMIAAGFVVTVLSIIAYCVTCFAAGNSAELGEILLANAVPFARITLLGLGIGSALWLVGSFTYLHGVMSADEQATTQLNGALHN